MTVNTLEQLRKNLCLINSRLDTYRSDLATFDTISPESRKNAASAIGFYLDEIEAHKNKRQLLTKYISILESQEFKSVLTIEEYYL